GGMRRQQIIAFPGGATVVWPLAVHAQDRPPRLMATRVLERVVPCEAGFPPHSHHGAVAPPQRVAATCRTMRMASEIGAATCARSRSRRADVLPHCVRSRSRRADA